jgi:para-nitrobenzyl esterase
MSMHSRPIRSGAFASALAVAAFLVGTPTPSRAENQTKAQTKIQTSEGPVEGFMKDGVRTFLGIPYAEPPIGNLRWRPPVKHASWTSVLPAKAFGPTCAQVTTLGAFAGPANSNEDCLYLNVFTPHSSPPAGRKFPVIVFIHGGGLVDGESNDYDATKLVADGGVVVVTLNYRLSLFGFLAHPALDKEGHLFGNYGLLDQQAALRWVNRNIGKFGGEKNNVTLAGQSAGSRSAAVNMLSPLAKGLFHRAILESDAYAGLTPVSTAETKGTAFAVAAGCGAAPGEAAAQCLRALPASRIMALSGKPNANGPFITGFIADGKILPISEMGAYEKGRFNHVPVMNGIVHDEGNFNIGITEYFSGPPRSAPTKADYESTVKKTYKGNAGPGGAPPAYAADMADRVLTKYPVNTYPSPQLALDAVATDVVACRSRRIDQVLARQVPVYAYQFDDRTAPYYFPDMPNFVPYAYHTSDLQYLFPRFHGGPEGIPRALNAKQQILSDQLVASWANFAKKGNPNGSSDQHWPRFSGRATAPSFLSENIPVLSTFTDRQYDEAHQCAFWDQVLVY